MLDHLLAILLILALPLRALVRTASDRPKVRRYAQSTGIVAALLAILVLDWLLAGRRVDALGLGWPTARTILPLIVTLIAFVLLFGITYYRRAPIADAGGRAQLLLPQTMEERRWFLLFIVTVGFGWEVLYRGFLWFYHVPVAGAPIAVGVSALAYALAHGRQSAKRLAGSLAAALFFTLGFTQAGNLWWLIVLHIGLPLVGLAAAHSATAADTK